MSHLQKDRSRNGAGSTMTEPVKESTSKVGDFIKEAASNVAQKTAAAGSYLGHKAEDATTAVGGEIKSLADAIRDKGPQEGMLGSANAAVATTLDTCGRELEHGLSGVADDVTNLVRRHPVPSVLIGIGLGILMARMISK